MRVDDGLTLSVNDGLVLALRADTFQGTEAVNVWAAHMVRAMG